MSDSPEGVRLDKWLWAARFFKTRGLANESVCGGHVHLNGARPKPSRTLRVGDRLEVVRGEQRFEVEVVALSERRGPASEAQRLYAESAQSVAARLQQSEQRRLTGPAAPAPERRPDKRSRRQIRRFIGRE